MWAYVVRRVLIMIPMFFAISLITFFIIQLPPGDYVTSYIASLRTSGDSVDSNLAELLRYQYGLDQPFAVQYWRWITGVLRGDFGFSLSWGKPVGQLIWERVGLTFVISLSTMLFVYALAIPIGIYSATHQYSAGDFVFSTIAFLGKATPDFTVALALMLIMYFSFGMNIGGLFSPQFEAAPWTWAKVWDLIKHLGIPLFVIGTDGTCGLTRVMRAQLLDEMQKPYVEMARAKGLKQRKLIGKYPVRVALNPILCSVGWHLPGLISGTTIVSIVLNLPTTGPLLLNALMQQDMYLAGSFLLILSTLTLIGTLISDIILAWVDPRIRMEKNV
jgi:peptide/nickel transport system permease protein